MRRGHGRGAGVGDGRQAGLGNQAHILAGQGRGQQFAPQRVARCRVASAAALGRARQFADVDGLQRPLKRHHGVHALEKGTCAARVLGQPMLHVRRALQHAQRQHLLDVHRLGAEVQRVRHQQQPAAARRTHAPALRSGSMPARRSSSLVRISGRPTSAVGSSESIALSSAMPSVSHLALPAQS